MKPAKSASHTDAIERHDPRMALNQQLLGVVERLVENRDAVGLTLLQSRAEQALWHVNIPGNKDSYATILDKTLRQSGEEGKKIKTLLSASARQSAREDAKYRPHRHAAAGVLATAFLMGGAAVATSLSPRHTQSVQAAQAEHAEIKQQMAEGEAWLDKVGHPEVAKFVHPAQERFFEKWLPELKDDTREKVERYLELSNRDAALEPAMRRDDWITPGAAALAVLTRVTALIAGSVKNAATADAKDAIAEDCLKDLRRYIHAHRDPEPRRMIR